jgi:predicted double-glycine peptidase
MSMHGLCVAALLGLAVTGASAQGNPAFGVESLKEIREKAVVMQRWDNSCAAAALATVLTYGFQDPVSERFVAAKMLEHTEPAKVRARGGFSLLDMKRFVEGRAYAADAYQHLSLEQLRLFRAPIVPISAYGANHYVVVNAVDGEQVLLADPAFGNRTMTAAQFKEAWVNGLAFVVTSRTRSQP